MAADAKKKTGRLGFRYNPADKLYRAFGDSEARPPWEEGELLDAEAPVALPAAAAVFSYGMGAIEGLKVERTEDGRLLLFRARDHGLRFVESAERLMMLPFPPDRFVEAVEQVVGANERFVPPPGQGTFYLRPTEQAIEPMLGLRRARYFTVTIFGCPVGEMPFAARAQGMRLKVLPLCRAAPGGTGAAKVIGNYAGTLLHRERARADGFDDVLYMDAADRGLLQETGGANVFCRLSSGALVTPALGDTILAGITRDCAIAIAQAEGVTVEQRPLPLQEVLDDGVELFCTGTAWSVRSVSELGTDDGVRHFENAQIARHIHATLRGIQSGAQDDPFGWTRDALSK